MSDEVFLTLLSKNPFLVYPRETVVGMLGYLIDYVLTNISQGIVFPYQPRYWQHTPRLIGNYFPVPVIALVACDFLSGGLSIYKINFLGLRQITRQEVEVTFLHFYKTEL